MKKGKNESPEIRRSLQEPIYVFHDSEQKVEFKARMKPISHFNCNILEGCKNSKKFNKMFLVMDSQNFVFLGCPL